MNAMELVRLAPLMQRSTGRAEIGVALIDGPVLISSPSLWGTNIRQMKSEIPSRCTEPSSNACKHGTRVASILAARRGSHAPAICPDCTLLIRTVFSEKSKSVGEIPKASAGELAQAILDAVQSRARVINLSLTVAATSTRDKNELEDAISYAATSGVIVAVAAGNQREVGGSLLSSHPWPIPVAGSDWRGQPTVTTNLGRSIGRHGLRGPSENIPSFGPNGQVETFSGTSAAVPFVSGTIALLWSEFPAASASAVKLAIMGAEQSARRAIVPPLLDAQAAYEAMVNSSGRKAL